MQRPLIVIAGSLSVSLTNFRGPLIAQLVSTGYRVIACAPDTNPVVIQEILALGAEFRVVPMRRTGQNPLHDLRTLFSYIRLLRRERPKVVLAYTLKPIVYAGLALRFFHAPRFVAMMTGLGYVFGETGSSGWLQWLTARLNRAALRRAQDILVFNRDDADELLRRRMIDDRSLVTLVPGSGVDLQRFARRPLANGMPVFLLVARLLADKGIGEFVAAAAIVRASFPGARFQLLGPFDSNPAAISPAQIESWVSMGNVEYLGSTRDVRPFYAQCTTCVLPSYREGLPRTVIEAMATGRAIITTDVPGCRDTVEVGRNGFLVRARDVQDLANAMMRFCHDPSLATRMGEASYRMATDRFDVRKINRQLLDIIGHLARRSDPEDLPCVPLSAQCHRSMQ